MSQYFEKLESRNKNERKQAAQALGNVRTKVSLRALLDTAQNDPDKDVRKLAIDSIVKLGDPEAVSVLEKISRDDKDRGVRNKAKNAISKVKSSGRSLPESEDYSAQDAERAREDARAFEEHEKRQAGLKVKLEEKLKYRIDRDNNLIDEEGNPITSLKGTGKIEVANTGRKDRIWGIDATLEGVDEVTFKVDEEQGTAVFGNSFALKELNPQDSKHVPFEFEVAAPKLKLEEDFWDLEKSDSPPLFIRGEETGMKFTVSLTNEFEWPLNNVLLKKYILDDSTRLSEFDADEGNMSEASDDKGRHLLWKIDEIPAGQTVKASCQFSVTLPEGGNDPYTIGDTVVTYHAVDNTLSGLKLETISGSSSVFQFISREEQEENPGDFDCQFELENTSEFEMDLREIRIFEGPLDEGNVRLEWLGKDFPEEERSIDPGETFKLDPWTITVDEDGVIPQFGREIDLSVKYLFDAEVVAECVLTRYALPFMGIEVTKTFEPLTIPSYRKTEILSEHVIKSVGSTEIQYLQLKDSIPEGFEAPTKDQVVIMKGETQLVDFDFDTTGNEVIITMEHLEDSVIGELKQDEEITVKYPVYIKAKPEEEFTGKVVIYGNIYPEVKPITAEAESGTITVVHERRKIKIGKMVSSTASDDPNEYEIVLRGVNEGNAVIKNVEITDFLPSGFELVSETEEDPPVGFEEHSSVKGGRAIKWVYESIEPQQKVEIRFKIRAPGDHDPKDVHRMLLG
ncbi:MAG: HEAT repeat domain-containing protein [Candidatus Hodarchaeales archaeon]